MTTRRNFLKQSLLAAGAASVPAGNLLAQEKMEEKRPKYNLPYKNTYLKEPFVTENEFRTAKPETITPGTFEEAKQILPDPTWSGHEKEIEMYWKAWQIGIGNIKAPEPDSGFVCSYLDVAYNGNIFMWDSAFMMMFARFGTRFFPFQRTLDTPNNIRTVSSAGRSRRTERIVSSVTTRPVPDRTSSLGARSSIISSSAI